MSGKMLPHKLINPDICLFRFLVIRLQNSIN